eukprot:TRINITY_DN17122_c0_g1_i1.p1 TRINITY_DN17122_c0_g1~~TRINITY_DN17122_c0_g1_i1.p1  ORF type:complete len:103 (-),score=21.36 TRINITY_DN17122_c0_g1_i1:10-318(-)
MSSEGTQSSSASTSTTSTSTEAPKKVEEGTDLKVESKFRPAKSIDFQEGKAIYVRGKRGICKRYEYPLVYWIYDGEESEKHRKIGRAVQQECRDRSRMPSSA